MVTSKIYQNWLWTVYKKWRLKGCASMFLPLLKGSDNLKWVLEYVWLLMPTWNVPTLLFYTEFFSKS